MALGSKRVVTDNRVPIWQRNPQNVQGGFGLDMTGLTAGVVVPSGALVIYDESTRLAKVVKSAKAYEAVGAAATAIKINKGSFYLVGDAFKTKTITAIDTSNDAYDVLTLAEGVVVSAGEIVLSEATTGKTTGLLYTEVIAADNESVAVAIAGTVYARRIPPVAASNIPATIILSNSY